VANAAGCIGLYAQLTVTLLPGLVMTGRSLIAVHVDMAVFTILRRPVRVLADPHNLFLREPGRHGQVFIKQGCMTIAALVRHGIGMNKDVPLPLRCRLPFLQVGKELFLVAIAACFQAHLFRFHLVVAVDAGFVRNSFERGFAMTVAAIHSVFGDMEVVAEIQLNVLLFASGKQQRSDQKG
jgi:hypothetical protein